MKIDNEIIMSFNPTLNNTDIPDKTGLLLFSQSYRLFLLQIALIFISIIIVT